MDKKRAILNITIGFGFKIIVLLLAIISKSFVVRHLGDEVNGLYSLFVSILGFLSVAELGIGSAITFSMYKPIVDNDKDSVSALYYLFRKFYLIVFTIMLVVGLLITPLLPYLAKGSSGEVNIYINYLIFLVSVSITYLFGHKTSLINAYKDNYITTSITSITLIIEGILQIIVIMVTKSFVLFLLVRILSQLINGIVTEIVYRLKYKSNINDNKNIDVDKKTELFKNSKALMYYRVGSKLISTFDGIIISSLIGVVALGYYSNYLVIITGMTSLLTIMFTEITSIIGHNYAKSTKDKYYQSFKKAYVVNFIVGTIFYLGFISISDFLITIMFGEDKIQTTLLVVIIGVNYYTQFARESVRLFKTASGQFHQDRFRPLIEGIINIILSVIFALKWGIVGILIATIISKLIITYLYEPLILYRDTFNKSPRKFYFAHYSNFLIFVIVSLIYSLLPIPKMNNIYVNILINGTISVMLSLATFVVIYIIYKPFRVVLNNIIIDFKNIRKIRKLEKNK